MTDQKILALNDAEVRLVNDNLRLAGDLAARYVGRREPLPSLELLNETFLAWAKAEPEHREHPNIIVNALGMALGQHLVSAAGLEWAVVADEQGSDLAVHGQPGDILVFPTHATAKRCESKEYDFFRWFFETIVQEVNRMKAEWRQPSSASGRTRA